MISISIDKIRKETNVADTLVGDAQILLYNQDAQNIFEAETGFVLETKEVTERYSGDGKTFLLLRNYPIDYVSSLKIDDVEVEDLGVTPVDPTIYYVDKISGKITFITSGVSFTTGVANVQAVYNYHDANSVAISETAMFYMICIDVLVDAGNYESEGITSEKFDKYSVSYSDGPYDGAINRLQDKLDRSMVAAGRRTENDVIG